MLQRDVLFLGLEEKAVGTDWRRSSIFTLRHAAGAEKYLQERRKEDADDVAWIELAKMFDADLTRD